MQKKPAPLVAMDFDLPAGDGFVAARADATLIERGPFPSPIGCPQNVETFFWGKMLLHALRNTRDPVSQSGAGMNRAYTKS